MRDFTSEENEDQGGGVWIVEHRPPLREGKVFVDFDERATIAESLEAAYLALDHAFCGMSQHSWWSPGRPACLGMADAYYAAVRLFGSSHYASGDPSTPMG